LVIVSFTIAVVVAGLSIFLKNFNSTKFLGQESTLPEGSEFEIHFFDVGEADSALVECDGKYMLIDGGKAWNSSFLYSYLEIHNIDYIDFIVCTHAHADHVGGLAGALNYATVGVAYCPVAEYDSRTFSSFVKYLDAQDKTITVANTNTGTHTIAAEFRDANLMTQEENEAFQVATAAITDYLSGHDLNVYLTVLD
jgi:competence protein ComEC